MKTKTHNGNQICATADFSFEDGVTLSKRQFNEMIARIRHLELENKRLEEIMIEYESLEKTNLDLSKEDVKFILMKCHPDKNPNSEKAIQLTKKLLKNRNR